MSWWPDTYSQTAGITTATTNLTYTFNAPPSDPFRQALDALAADLDWWRRAAKLDYRADRQREAMRRRGSDHVRRLEVAVRDALAPIDLAVAPRGQRAPRRGPRRSRRMLGRAHPRNRRTA